MLSELFEVLYSIFMTITNMFIKLMSFAIFASMTIMIVDMGREFLFHILVEMGVFFLAIAIILCVYGLLVFGLSRCNPFTLFKKTREGMPLD